MFLKKWMSFSFQSVLLQSGCGAPSVWIGSVLATKKNVAGKPYWSRMGTACSNWHRSPSSKVRDTSAGLSMMVDFQFLVGFVNGPRKLRKDRSKSMGEGKANTDEWSAFCRGGPTSSPWPGFMP